jgi:hypothetical protein
MHDGLKDVSVDLDSDGYTVNKAGGAAYIPGAITWQYDGFNPVEASFMMYPEMDIDFGATAHPDVTVSQPGGQAIPAGTYGYKVYYEWHNKAGELIRSSAIPFSVLVSVTSKVTLTIPTLAHTQKFGLRGDVSIGVFRTSATGTVYHRCSGIDPSVTTGDNPYVFNDTDVDSVSFVDNMTDTTLLDNEIDPQTGGILDNVSFPASTVMVEAKRRLFFAGGSIKSNRVFYSKLRSDGVPVEFNDALSIELPDRGGAVTALTELRDNLIVFKKSQIYAVSGDGPNNAGFGDFQEPVLISSDVGCKDVRSVVITPDGVMFQSDKGIYLLSKDFSVAYIGAEVEAFNSLTITSAELVPDQNIVMFLSSDGSTLVYDYIFRQWSTFTNHQGVSGTLWNGKYTYIDSNGNVFRQNSDKYTDGNTAYKLRLKTGPIRIDDLQNFWRCKRVYVLAEYFSSHKLRMNTWFNRELAPRETEIFDPLDFISDEKWGDNDFWGAGAVWGGDIDSRDYQFSYAPATQKCQSVSFEFEEIPGTEAGRAFELTELALMWAPMQGLGRLEAARRK